MPTKQNGCCSPEPTTLTTVLFKSAFLMVWSLEVPHYNYSSICVDDKFTFKPHINALFFFIFLKESCGSNLSVSTRWCKLCSSLLLQCMCVCGSTVVQWLAFLPHSEMVLDSNIPASQGPYVWRTEEQSLFHVSGKEVRGSQKDQQWQSAQGRWDTKGSTNCLSALVDIPV